MQLLVHRHGGMFFDVVRERRVPHTGAVGTVPFVLGLVVAVVISGQVLLPMERHRSIGKRLRDLGKGGDAFALLLAALLTFGAPAAVIGSLAGSPGRGGTAGLVLAFLTWTVAVT